MKTFIIEWETDYCDDFPERRGTSIVMADTEDEAARKFAELKITKACIMNITEREENNV